jgi:superfamily II DNA helicase RecQ
MGDLEIHDLILERGHIRDKWSEISDTINVPKTIYDHQADTMALLLARKNVLCALPTGGGKTLAQLASVFVTGGTALVIPPC